jgi:gliding motility-associated-like protein
MIVCSSKEQYENATYTWNFGDGKYGTGRSVNHEYSTNGNYNITLIIRDSRSNKILGKTTETISVNALPKVDFSWNQQNVVIPTLDFINLSDESANWEWKVNGQLVSDQTQMAHTFRAKGTYHVDLTATNDLGCTNTLTKDVEIADDYNLLAPTAFSPNGDNLNETFIPSALKIMESEFTMMIYNQAGEQIFTSKTVNNPWDGSNVNDNSLVPDGAYIWIVTLKNANGLMETYKGQIMVIR